ncbi:MAG: TrkA C-terminal domain-containing protein [Halobacteriota archaeon]
MDYRVDDIDRQIIYALMRNARNTSAPMIADEVNVSPGTIRNRIRQLEEHDILSGYHASVKFEHVDRYLTNLFICSVSVPDRERLAKQVLEISGVVNVRELMTGRGNVHVLAIGKDMTDVSRIARELSNHGIEIEDEFLVQEESFGAYQPFGPSGGTGYGALADFMSLAGGAEIVELVVDADATVAGKTLSEAGAEGLLEPDCLVVSIERDDTVVTPRGDTAIAPDDLVTLFSRGGVDESTIELFGGDSR